MNDSLPPERLERLLPDAKPLYTPAEARAEADRCLYCADAPCIQACPTEIDVPTFIRKIASGNVRGAAKTILEQNMLGASCARVCPVEVMCVGSCVYNGWDRPPIQIGRLQRYATEVATREGERPLFVPEPAAASGKSIALVGAGPASLACAAELRLKGHRAVIFERGELPGGLNTTGVAPYKLHAEDSLAEVDWIRALGVELRTGVEIGSDMSGEQLLGQYDAIFLGVGTGADHQLGIPSELGHGVVGATDWIARLKLEKVAGPLTLGRVAVIGGGNTALDAARECALLGAEEVTLIYRRAESELGGYAHELAECRKAGVRLMAEVIPVAFLRDQTGKLHGLRLTRAASGQPVAGTEHDVPCDLAVVAIGQSKLGALAGQFPGVALDGRGCIVVNPGTGATGNPKVFSGGDCANGGREVVHAVADGRNAAREMIRRWAVA